MIALALAAQFGDLVTFVHMGMAYELNPLVQRMDVEFAVIAKLLLIAALVLWWLASSQRHPKVTRSLLWLELYAITFGLLGMTSNLLVILG